MKYFFCSFIILLNCFVVYSQQWTPAQEAFLKEARYLSENQNKIENVPRILKLMRDTGITDMNKDGKIDCIDYSTLFRLYYGSNAHIMINKNPINGMNHMFIRIYYGGTKILDIEPQGEPDRYSMGLIWGVKYNPYYNRDVTSQWSHVVGGMY